MPSEWTVPNLGGQIQLTVPGSAVPTSQSTLNAGNNPLTAGGDISSRSSITPGMSMVRDLTTR